MMKYVLTFPSVHFVMKAERILKKEDIDATAIPVPREISSDCGMALEVQCKSMEKINGILKDKNCKVTGVYEFPDK